MRNHVALIILGLAVAAASPSIAQTVSPSSGGGNSALSSQGNSGSQGNSSSNGISGGNSGAMSGSGSITGANATSGQTTVEGQLVDLFSAAQTSSGLSSSSGMTGSSASSAGLGNDTSTHLGDSTGTYNRPGAAAGSSDSSASMGGTGNGNTASSGNRSGSGSGAGGSLAGTGSGGNSSGNQQTGGSSAGSGLPGSSGGTSSTGGVTGSSSGLAGGESSHLPAAQDQIRSQLSSGIPAAVYSNGQMFVLACDPRQLSSCAGQNVRISGRVGSSNVLIPSRVEVRDSSGSYRSVALAMPHSSNTGAANER